MVNRRRSLPPLNALRAFESAARLRSLTLAAHELCVTQGAVSQQVKLLEEFLETQLFVRKARKLELTDAGRAFIPKLTEIFNGLYSTTEELFGGDQGSTLTIKCGSSFLQRWLIPNLYDFYEKHPDMRLRIRSTVWPSQDDIEEADLEICSGYGDWTGMQVEQLTQENWLVVASPHFLERNPVGHDAIRIAELPLISVFGYKENWPEWFRSQNISDIFPIPHLECDTNTLGIEAACHHLGVLLTRSFAAQPALKRGDLVQCHPHVMPSDGAHFYLVLPKKAPGPKVIAFQTWLRNRLKETHPVA